jgi:uncharacterized protein (DUF4415 family)
MVKKTLTDRNGEVRELTREDIAAMKPFEAVFPEIHENWRRGRGRPPKEQPKQRLTLRLDADIVVWLKEQGTGYQTRINSILREVMNDRRALPGR